MMGDARDIARMLGEKANPKVPTRVRATVTKVEPSKTWVRINGSSGETPCASTSASVKPGDAVSVLITGNRATIEGNYTSPATDDSKAIEAIKTGSSAQQTADMAHELATNAIADAQATRDAAERAEADATRAAIAAESSEASARASAASAASAADSAALSKEAADRAIVEAEKATAAAGEAYRKAEEAGDEAIRANSYAVGALNGLSAVQDVMGVIEWARDNGEFVAATGDFDPTATYFVADPEGNYTDGTNRYSVVAEPDADSFAAGDYYVLDVSEAMADFVNSHLAVADEGLYVSQQLSRNEDGTIDFCGNSYVLITPTGFEVYDSFGRLVTKYGAEMVMGNGATKTTINSQYLELNWTHDVMTDDGLVTVTDNVFSVGVKEEGDTPSLSFMNGSVFFGRDGRTIICNGRFEMQPNGDAELDNGEIKMSIEGREFRVRRYQEVRSGDVIQEVEERLLDVGIDDDGKRYLTFAKGGRSQNGSTPEAVTTLFSVGDDGTPTFGDVPGARTNLGVPSLTNGGSYWGLGFPDGTNVGYMRTPSSGLIPRMEGGVENTYLGTSGWPFYQCHAKEFYGTWSGNPLSWSDLDTGVQDFVNNASFSAHARTTDLNPLMNGVKWWGSNCANIPSGESYGIVATFSNGTDPKSTGLWRRQIAFSTTGRTYTRQCINCPATTASTSWTSWIRVWDLSSILPVANGGTGLTTSPSLLINLASTSAASVFQASPRPGVTGKLPSENIADSAITSAKIANGAVTNAKLDSATQMAVENVSRGAAVSSAMGGGDIRLVKKGHVRILTICPFYFHGDTAKWTTYQIGTISNPVDRPSHDVAAALCCDGGVAFVYANSSGQILLNTRNTVITKNQWCYGQIVW